MGYGFTGDDATADSVGTAALEDGSVTTAKLDLAAVTTDRIADGAVTAEKLAADIVDTDQIADGAVGSDELATDSVIAAKIADGAVLEAHIANGAVTSGKIPENAIGSSHITNGSVGSDEIATGAVGSDELATDAVVEAKIADGAVTTDRIADDAVTAAKLAPGAVVEAATADGSVTVAKMATAQVITATGSVVASGGRVVTFAGAAGQTITLPPAASGRTFEVLNVDATDSLTLDGDGAETIGGVASVTVPAGGRYLLISRSSTWTIATLTVPLVSTLPAAPFDGMEVYYQDAAMATAGVVWTLRYNAGSAHAKKWELVGGPSLAAEVATDEATSSASFADLATVGPSLTPTLAGEFEVEIEARVYGAFSGTTREVQMSYAIGAAAAQSLDGLRVGLSAISEFAQPSRRKTKTLVAGDALVCKYSTTVNSGRFLERRLAIRPIRVG